jgi:hypothetical protein
VPERSLAELRYAAHIFDLIGGLDSVIVPHTGRAYEDRSATAATRFVETMRPEMAAL